VTAEEEAKFVRLGGAEWLRAALKRGEHLPLLLDRPGFISAKLARHYFERAVRENAFLSMLLDCSVDAKGLVEYANKTTHAVWVGWALGMRCAERLEHAQRAQDIGVGPTQRLT
jgi:hypothetical protein